MLGLNLFTGYFWSVSFLLLIVLVIDMIDMRRDWNSLGSLRLYYKKPFENRTTETTVEERFAVLENKFPARSYSALSEIEKVDLEISLILLKKEFYPENSVHQPPAASS